jgi:hypothetical protein
MDLTRELHDPAVIDLARNLREMCGDDDLAFIDTLDGCSNAVEAVRSTLRAIASWEAMEAAAKALRDRYAARAQDFAARQERARNALVQFMGDVGEKSMVLPEATITRKAGAAKVVGEGDPETMPAEFVRTKTTRELDKTAIKRALEQGQDVPGFMLSNGCETLQIRK